jgi:hypothetical protein
MERHHKVLFDVFAYIVYFKGSRCSKELSHVVNR